MDSVGDLARVMRLPGTVNRKGDPPVEVRVVESNDRRYNPGDLEAFMAEEIPAETPEVHVGALALRPDAEPPTEKLNRLICNSKAFSDSWNQWRGDLSDQSQSTYDQSLADIVERVDGPRDSRPPHRRSAQARPQAGESAPRRLCRQGHLIGSKWSAGKVRRRRKPLRLPAPARLLNPPLRTMNIPSSRPRRAPDN